MSLSVEQGLLCNPGRRERASEISVVELCRCPFFTKFLREVNFTRHFGSGIHAHMKNERAAGQGFNPLLRDLGTHDMFGRMFLLLT